MIRCLLLSAFVSIFASAAAANTSAWSLREYVQTMWTHRNGLPLAPLGDFTQTSDGYLWFLSERGGALTRFDGVQFATFSAPCNVMQSLRADANGGLWILCRDAEYKLFRRQTGRPIVEVPLAGAAVAREQPALLWIDSRDRLWILGDVIARHQPDGSFRTFGHLPLRSRTVAEDAAGAVWVSDGQNVLRIHDDRAESLIVGGNVFGTPRSGVHASNLSSISRLVGQSFTTVARASDGLTFGNQSVIDSSGAVWTITPQYGIARTENGRIETLLSPGDVGSSVSEVFIDREENVWVATAAGLHRFRKPHARLLHALGGQVPPKPVMVWVDPQNDLWVGNEHEVSHTSSATGIIRRFTALMPSALAQDREGHVWLGAQDQLYRVASGELRAVVDVAGAPIPRVRQIVSGTNGDLWAVAQGIGVYRLTPGSPRLVESLPGADADVVVSSTLGTWVAAGGRSITHIPPDGAAITHRLTDSGSGAIMRIAERGDSVWVGHMRGLSRWRNGRWTTWSRAQGLPGRGAVQEIISDHLGRVWLLSDLGILGVSAAELDATPDGAPSPLRFVRIGELDRVMPHPGNLSASPRASKDRDGRLYFATVDSIVVVDPAAVTESKVRPTIVLESMSADGQVVEQSEPAELAMPSKLEFDYTSLSLRSPETIRFRYKLEGYDTDWIEAGGTRRASYGTLQPGTYRFHVVGSGSEGIWNEEGASHAFTIVPLFYNTWWFRGTAVLLLVAVFAGGHRLRVRRLTRQMQREFDARLAERTRIAQELHDTLLQGTLAASLHAQLAEQAVQKAPDSPTIDEIRTPVKQVVELLARVARDSRAVLNGLRATPADADIAQALHRAAGEQPNSSDIDFRLSVLGDARTLKPAVVEHVIRIAGEAVANAYQHAKAQRVTADLIYTDQGFQCIVRDDGQGMNAAVLEHGRHGHWGLAGMRERAERAGGQLHLRSSATAGTEVELSLPASLAYS